MSVISVRPQKKQTKTKTTTTRTRTTSQTTTTTTTTNILYILVQLMRSQNGRISRQILKVVHNDGHEKIQHQKHANEDERDEINVSKGRAAIDFAGDSRDSRMTLGADARQHDLLPRLAGAAAKQQQETQEEVGEVVVPIDGGIWGILRQIAEYLHPNDGVDEEEDEDQQTNVRQRLEGLDERPQESSDAFAASKEFDQSRGSEES